MGKVRQRERLLRQESGPALPVEIIIMGVLFAVSWLGLFLWFG